MQAPLPACTPSWKGAASNFRVLWVTSNASSHHTIAASCDKVDSPLSAEPPWNQLLDPSAPEDLGCHSGVLKTH